MNALRILISIVLAELCFVRPFALAEPQVDIVGDGVTFSVPSALRPGVPDALAIRSWKNSESSVSVLVLLVPHPQGGATVISRELSNWEATGPLMVEAAARENVAQWQGAWNVECSAKGVPLDRDLERMTAQIQVDVTCATSPVRVLRERVIAVATRSEQVVIRVASLIDEPDAEAIAAEIWQTIRNPNAAPKPDSAGSVGRTRASYTAGVLFGALLLAFTAVFVFTTLCMRLGMRPWPALIAPQLLVLAVRIWANNGELNWLVFILPPIIAVLSLRGWAQRRWAERTRPLEGSFESRGPVR